MNNRRQQTTQSLPTVSIVTPSYNQGKYLAETIESVLSQGYPNIEYMVFDGGSTDNSVDILESYSDKIKWVSEKDNGQTHAINKGFEKATGDIRAYLNSDDILKSDAVQKVVDYFLHHPDCDMVYGRAEYIDEGGRVNGMYNTADYSFDNLMAYCCICQPAAFWRTETALRIGPFNEKLSFAMDYEYWLRMARASCRIEHIPEVLAASRLHAEAKTLSSQKSFFNEIFQVCLKIGGYVHFNWFNSYWQFRLSGESALAAQPLKGIKAKQKILFALIHHRWFHLRRTLSKTSGKRISISQK